MKSKLAIALALAMAFLLSGCMRMQVNVELEEDDKASGSIVFAVSDTAAEQLGVSPDELFTAMTAEGDVAPEGSTAEDYAQDGYTGKKYTFESQPLDSSFNDPNLTITRDGDDYVVTGKFNAEEAGIPAENEDDPAVTALLEQVDISFNITFPGEVKESNGTVNGKTVTWTYAIGEDLTMSARGSAESSGAGMPALLVIGLTIGALILVGAIIAGVVASNNRKKSFDDDPGPYPAAGSQTFQQGYQPGGYTQPGQPDYTPPMGHDEPHARSHPDYEAEPHDEAPTPTTDTPTEENEESPPTEQQGYTQPQQDYTPPPPTQQFPQPPVDPQNPENPQQ
ncbi:LppM family (lipo)protein [Timonella sp. A28]|uniref:LppM family (lipo)protein n=1 Tax=Timonella sp. A28 TaxID=3442640 RepID=UPI003EBD7371